MQIKLENIGIVKNSSIALNGLTVIQEKTILESRQQEKRCMHCQILISNISEKFEKDKCNYIKKTLDEIGEDLHFLAIDKGL